MSRTRFLPRARCSALYYSAAAIFTRSKLDWLVLPAGARVFEVYYDMEKE